MSISPKKDFRGRLAELADSGLGPVRFAEPLMNHCSWRIGGPADAVIEPDGMAQVAAVVRFARRHAILLVVIGQGTNLLFDDAGLRGLVLKIGARLSRVEIAGNRITARAGVWVPQLARLAAQAGLSGLEHTIGIPGTLGGLAVMNGGSQRRAIGDHLLRLWAVNRAGDEVVLTRDQCQFGYRRSALQNSGAVVVQAELELAQQDPRQMRKAMLADLRERRRKCPRKGEPNCGSVFLSTAEMHATVGPPGRIIEEAGLKGARIGGAEVSFRHANFIVNRGGATCRDILLLIDLVRRTVREKIRFELHCEVRYVRPNGEMAPADRHHPGRASKAL
jgi:UDP-N-acetylmuramate dehydrogenase